MHQKSLNPDMNITFNAGKETLAPITTKAGNPIKMAGKLPNSHNLGLDMSFPTPGTTKRSASKSNRFQIYKGGTVPEKYNSAGKKLNL